MLKFRKWQEEMTADSVYSLWPQRISLKEAILKEEEKRKMSDTET